MGSFRGIYSGLGRRDSRHGGHAPPGVPRSSAFAFLADGKRPPTVDDGRDSQILIPIPRRVRKRPFFGTLVAIHFQYRIPDLRTIPGTDPTDPANPLISGATFSMSEQTFAHLEAFSGLAFQRTDAVDVANVFGGLYATS